MKTTRNYLTQTSKHLFKFENGDKVYFQKVVVKDNKYYVYKFDLELKLISVKENNISETVSSAGKAYVPTYLKNGWGDGLFYRGDYNNTKITTIKHFKAFREALETQVSKLNVAA